MKAHTDDSRNKKSVTREFSNLCVLVLKSTTDTSAELSDSRHVGRQTVHFVFHLFEVILHLSYRVCKENKKKKQNTLIVNVSTI